MKIHREGYSLVLYSLGATAVLNTIIILLFNEIKYLWIGTLSISALFVCFLLYFFRKAERELSEDAAKIFVPADGEVVAMEESFEDEYFKDKRLQLSVFMTIFNVHSNTYPVSGKIKYIKYHPGKFFIASHPKSSVYNERLSLVIETEQGVEILVRQIAGMVARRIVSYASQGAEVKQGDELGFIKFGSRVDVFLPPGTKPEVVLHQKVRANIDILAKLDNQQ
ncbi:MAG: phosphatidylserine decarboxylase family protein [Bacteroidales bacterium]|nr:phosphatidylserine decarboxylase family protein [Bacteroidales bacterium]